MEFRTKYDRVVKNSESGDSIRIVKSAQLGKDKVLEVVEKAKEDFYAYINSFADSVDIHVLLNRFKNGDKEALVQRAGAYIDISALPTNINEFLELSRNAEELFNSLPIETKQAFNNNVVEFISTIGDDSWNEKMAKSPDQIYKDKNESYKEANNAHKEAVKMKNSVYGDQEPIEDPVYPEKPTINPLTGNEVA